MGSKEFLSLSILKFITLLFPIKSPIKFSYTLSDRPVYSYICSSCLHRLKKKIMILYIKKNGSFFNTFNLILNYSAIKIVRPSQQNPQKVCMRHVRDNDKRNYYSVERHIDKWRNSTLLTETIAVFIKYEYSSTLFIQYMY